MTNVGWNVARRARPIVQHRIDQNLQTDWYLTAVSRCDCKSGVMAAPGTLSLDSNPFGIHSQVLCVGEQPVERCIVIVKRTWKMCLRREPVINGHGHAVMSDHQILKRPLLCKAHDVTSSVDMKNRGFRGTRRSSGYIDPDLRRAGGAVDHLLLDSRFWKKRHLPMSRSLSLLGQRRRIQLRHRSRAKKALE